MPLNEREAVLMPGLKPTGLMTSLRPFVLVRLEFRGLLGRWRSLLSLRDGRAGPGSQKADHEGRLQGSIENRHSAHVHHLAFGFLLGVPSPPTPSLDRKPEAKLSPEGKFARC